MQLLLSSRRDSGLTETSYLYQFIMKEIAMKRGTLQPGEELVPIWKELATLPILLQGGVTSKYAARTMIVNYTMRWAEADLKLQCAKPARLWTYITHMKARPLHIIVVTHKLKLHVSMFVSNKQQKLGHHVLLFCVVSTHKHIPWLSMTHIR